MKRYQIIASGFWVLLGMLIMYYSYRLGLQGLHDPGPGLMGFLIGALLIVVSLYHLVTLVREQKVDNNVSNPRDKVQYKTVSLVIIFLFGYAVLLEPLGYLLTTCVVLIALFRLMRLRWTVVFIASTSAAFITYFGFTKLGVILPIGIINY